VPLKSKERVVGSLILVSLSQSNAFSSLDLRLLSAFAAQAALAIENATLYEELQRKESLRGDLLRKVITAQEEERKRIARDLHDDTSQALAALMVTMDTATMMTSSDGEQLKDKLASMKGLAARALEGVHQMIYYLRPSVLDDLGLLSAIKWYAESRLEELGVKVGFESSGTETRLPSQTETALFRAVQEAINNIARHAEAENVLIEVYFKGSALVIEVEDDGRGFDVEAVAKLSGQGEGFGLAGMRERIALLDGTLTIQSEPSSGTQVRMEIPLAPEESSHG
jgi:signal transduction histidine kinase